MAREMRNWTHKLHGEVPYNWKMVKLKHISTFTNGYSFKSSEYEDGEYAVITIANVQSCRLDLSNYNTVKAIPKDINPAQILKVGDMLVSMTGYVGRVCIVDKENCLLNQRVGKIRFTEKVDHIFIQYALSSGTFEEYLSFNSNGSAQQNASTYDINNFVFPLPPLSEQKAIADFLDAKCGEIDGLLADLDAEVNTLTEYKKSIIAETVTRGLNPNAPMKSSGIPWAETIPAHWKVEPVYTHFHDKIFLNLDYEYQRAFKFKYGTLEYKNEVGDLAFYMPTYIKYSKVKKGDIIINGLNLNYDFISQRVAITPEDGIITSAYLAIRPLEGVIPSYFCYLFKAMDNMKLFHGMGKGIRLTLSFDELKRVRIPIPNMDEQIEIANYLDSKCAAIDQAITDKTQQIETLKAYKSSLIYEYVTGKKQVAL